MANHPNPPVDDLQKRVNERTGTRKLSGESFKNFAFPTSGMTRQDGGQIVIYIAEHGVLHVIRSGEKVKIGRKQFGNDFLPEIDLTDYHGRHLGVSRHHATITSVGGEFYISDNNSTNGTWVNEQQLTPNQQFPIRYGDTVRLGHMMLTIG